MLIVAVGDSRLLFEKLVVLLGSRQVGLFIKGTPEPRATCLAAPFGGFETCRIWRRSFVWLFLMWVVKVVV